MILVEQTREMHGCFFICWTEVVPSFSIMGVNLCSFLAIRNNLFVCRCDSIEFTLLEKLFLLNLEGFELPFA